MKILVTGAAGFIGFHTVLKLSTTPYEIVALDNLNDYYDPQLKFDRLQYLGFRKENIRDQQPLRSDKFPNLQFIRLSLENKPAITDLFSQFHFDIVLNLAAQAGVRYSLQNPGAYISSNIEGFFNILEACRHFPVKHLIYASSSSVYGLNEKIPFSPDDNTDRPISLYAATKKSNELMAYTYHHLFKIPMTGLRFFTVYGPWGRPDMAYFSFSKNIIEGKEIQIYNHGDQRRDFTFIDDIVSGITQLMDHALESPDKFRYNIYNLGNNQPVKLIDFVETLESLLDAKALKKYLPGQPGDVTTTFADISASQRDFSYHPHTGIKEGLSKFVDWYRSYHKV
jgi:UDP-glucuronate 4-epimerase